MSRVEDNLIRSPIPSLDLRVYIFGNEMEEGIVQEIFNIRNISIS